MDGAAEKLVMSLCVPVGREISSAREGLVCSCANAGGEAESNSDVKKILSG